MISRTDKFPDARNIVITQVGDWDAPRVITDSEQGEVRWHEWSRDGRLIYRVDRGYEDTHRGSLAYLALFTIPRGRYAGAGGGHALQPTR